MSGYYGGFDSPDVKEKEMARRRREYFAQVDAIVSGGGTYYQAVFPVTDDGFHFCYTVGRARHGLPELIATGASQSAGPLFAWVEAHWAEAPELGDEWQMGNGRRLVLLPVDDRWRLELMTMTQQYAGTDFEAVQVVWDDDDGLFPWDRPDDPTFPILSPEIT